MSKNNEINEIKIINIKEFDSKPIEELYDGDWKEFKEYLDKISEELKKPKQNNKNNEENKKTTFINWTVESDNKYKLTFQNYAGFIWFKKIQINIFPKIFNATEFGDINKDDEKKDSMKRLIINMKHWCERTEYKNKYYFLNYFGSMGNLKKPKNTSIIDWFFEYYIEEVFKSFNKEIHHEYVLTNKDLLFVKGKINFNDYFNNKIPKCNPFKLNCSFFEYSHNNLFNKIVKKCLKIILQKFKKTDTRIYNLIQTILSYLSDIDDTNVFAKDLNSINIYNFSIQFKNILQMSKIILNNSYFDSYGNLIGFSFLLYMPGIFEAFVRAELEKNIKIDDKKPYKLGEWVDKNQEHIKPIVKHIEPDIVIVKDSFRIIADCKYKEIKDIGDIYNADLYQLITYNYIINSSCENGNQILPSSVVLIYPLFENESSIEFSKKFIINDKKKTNIWIVKIPFICDVETEKPVNNLSFIDQIKKNS